VTAPPSDSSLWQELAQNHNGDWFKPLNIGRDALEWRLRAIHSATSSVDLQTFLWKNDAVGTALAQALIVAADRGVTVRLLLDDSFTMHESEFFTRINAHENIESRIYNPFRYRPDSVALRQLFNLGEFSRIDRRMHNKVLVVDNFVSIIGGRNLADEYFGYHEKTNFRDMEVLAYGEVTQRISSNFDSYWNSGWAFPLEELTVTAASSSASTVGLTFAPLSKELPLRETEAASRSAWHEVAAAGVTGDAQLLADKPAEENPALEPATQLAEQMLSWIERAERELIAVSAYLIPTPELEQAIERATQRGVRVKVLTNSLRSNNHTAAHAAYHHHIARLMELGVQVYEMRSQSRGRGLYMQAPVDGKSLGLHAKFMLIDNDLSFIGSANLDARSLRLNTEIGLMIESPELNSQLREMIAHDFDRVNAWELQRSADGRIAWVGDDITLYKQPSDSVLQRLEDWFLGVLPIEGEM
jgi:putative cardiolipin synthase